jgi:hypothetical protein
MSRIPDALPTRVRTQGCRPTPLVSRRPPLPPEGVRASGSDVGLPFSSSPPVGDWKSKGRVGARKKSLVQILDRLPPGH